PHDPAEVAYTLQTGRKRHRCRLAVVAPDTDALRTRLEEVLHGAPDGPDVFRGEEGGEGEGRSIAPDAARSRDGQELRRLAKAWCDGHAVEWRTLYGTSVPRRVPLPTYPFKRQRIWIGDGTLPQVSPASAPDPAPPRPDPAPP